MSPVRKLAALATALLIGGCVVAPYYPYATSYPASFDRSWEAALGAAADAGVQITSAERAAGTISGSKAGALVTIELRPQADNTLKVIFTAPDSKEINPTLNDRWAAAYNRRMGR